MNFKFAMVVVIAALLPVAAIAGDQVPYKASLASTSFIIVFPGLGDTGRCASLPIADLPPGTGWGLIKITAVGHSTLMGLVTDIQSHCSVLPLDPNAPPPPVGTVVPAILGQSVITGANHDSLVGSYEATLTFTEAGAVIDGHFAINGGTGRFVGAKGEATAFGVQTQAGAALTLTGMMSSVGSVRKQ